MNTTDLYKENGSKLFFEIMMIEETSLDGGSSFTKNQIKFYFIDGDMYIAVDNTTCDCWTEEFNTSEEAIKWLTDDDSEE